MVERRKLRDALIPWHVLCLQAGAEDDAAYVLKKLIGAAPDPTTRLELVKRVLDEVGPRPEHLALLNDAARRTQDPDLLDQIDATRERLRVARQAEAAGLDGAGS